MQFVQNMTNRLLLERMRENGLPVDVNDANVGRSEPIHKNKKRTESKQPVFSNVETVKRLRTSRSHSRTTCLPIIDACQLNSTKSKVVTVERSSVIKQQERGAKSKDRALSNQEPVYRVRTRSQSSSHITHTQCAPKFNSESKISRK